MREVLRVAGFAFVLAAPSIAHGEDLKNESAHMRSPWMVAGGISSMVAGTAAVAVSSAFLLLAHSQTNCVLLPGGGCQTTPANRDFIIGGGLGVSLGGTAVVGGLILVILGAMPVSVERVGIRLTPNGVFGRF